MTDKNPILLASKRPFLDRYIDGEGDLDIGSSAVEV